MAPVWLILSTLALAAMAVASSAAELAQAWIHNDAYSHGFVLLAVALFLAVQKGPEIPDSAGPSRWYLPALGASVALMLVGGQSELHVLAQYGLFGLVGSLVLGVWGWPGVRVLFVPLLLLLLAIPMPGYFEVNLTTELKLLSSRLGTVLLQALGVPVYTEGNIIDLGSYQLQLADACSGLNYMVPLLAIGVMMAGFLRTSLWRRVVLVLLTIPLTVAMNVLRIAIAGLLVKHVGPETAEGFVHDFEGWLVFVASLGLMLPTLALLLRLGPGPTSVREALRVDLSLPVGWRIPVPPAARRNLLVGLAAALVLLAASNAHRIGDRSVPERMTFSVFPKLVGGWVGSHGVLDAASLEVLRLTDYLYGSYRAPGHAQPVEVLSTWYARQTDGATPHSPNICLPGAGWEILRLERTSVRLADGTEVPVNRAVMERRGEKMLAYYWFQQRGRLFANEFAMKWFIIQDSVLTNRADGGMVRLTTRLDGPVSAGDARLQDFMSAIWPILPRFLPD